MKYFIYLLIIVFPFVACKSKKNVANQKAKTEASSNEMTAEEKKAALIEEMKKENVPNEADEAYQRVQEEIVDSAVARIQKTACFGRCPIYTLTIYQSGYAEYFGKKWVEKEGLFSAQMTQEEIDLLINRAEEVGFFDFKNIYDKTAITDLPSVITSIRREDNLKTIINRFDGPQSLKRFEEHLESFSSSLKWTKVSQE